MHFPGPKAVLLINCLGIGGAERAVVGAARGLRLLGIDIRILCLESSPRPSIDCAVPVDRLSRMDPSASTIRKLAALPLLALRLRRYLSVNGAPVVMSHLFRANFVNVLTRLLWRSRHRVIVVNHTRLSRLRAEGVQGRVNLALSRLLYPKADTVASVSAGAAAEIARLLVLSEGRSLVLHDPIEIKVTRAKTEHSSIVCVGRLVRLKRYDELITSFARVCTEHAGLQLRVVGDGPQRLPLQELAERLGIADRVTFYGALVNPATALSGCCCFVSTSETEGFGMAIVEALASGVPVIAADCAYGPREILSPASDPSKLLVSGSGIELAPYGILYPVGSTTALDSALRTMLTDVALRARYRRKGPERAADFSLERAATQYERALFPA